MNGLYQVPGVSVRESMQDMLSRIVLGKETLVDKQNRKKIEKKESCLP